MTQDSTHPATRGTDRSGGRATRGLGAVLQVPGLPDAVLPALLRFSAHDPFAVRLVLLLAPDVDGTDSQDGIDSTGSHDGPESVEWVFSRSLLTEGLVAPVGSGDVRVRVRGREVAVELAGSATVLLPLEGLVEFLADSYEIVPTGAEPGGTQDLDDELAHLLG